jgi:hypothetical protein
VATKLGHQGDEVPTSGVAPEPDHRLAIEASVFVALTSLKLEIAAQILACLITRPNEMCGLNSAELVGEAFKHLSKAVGDALEGQVDPWYTKRFQRWASLYRQWQEGRPLNEESSIDGATGTHEDSSS